MPRKKKVENIEQQETKVTTNKLPTKGYYTFNDLTESDIDILIMYEEKVARFECRYIQSFDSKAIKEKYGNCTFPPFVLDMMKKVVKYS